MSADPRAHGVLQSLPVVANAGPKEISQSPLWLRSEWKRTSRPKARATCSGPRDSTTNSACSTACAEFSRRARPQPSSRTLRSEISRGARRLGVSPTADHFTELQDKGIQREVLNWFRQAAGLSPVSRGLRMETRSDLWLLAWLAALLAAVATLREIGGGRRWLLRFAAGTALFGVYLLARIGTRNFLFAADGIFWLIVFALFAGFVGLLRTENLARGLRTAARLGLVAWASLLLTFRSE